MTATKLTPEELAKWERDWDFHKWKQDLDKREVIFVVAEKAKEIIYGPNPQRKLLASPAP